MKRSRLLMVAALATVPLVASALPAQADTTIIVNEGSIAGTGQPATPIAGKWYARYVEGVYWDTKDGTDRFLTDGAVYFENGPAAPPAGAGSLVLETTEAGPTLTQLGGKATFFNYDWVGTRLDAVDRVAFWSYTTTSPIAASFQLEILRTAQGGFSTLNVEPYAVNGVNPTAGVWEQYVVGTGLPGKVWLTGVGGEGGQSWPVTWDRMLELFPNATVVGGAGFNLGRGPTVGKVHADKLEITSDGVTTTYDFEKAVTLAGKNECKDGGWTTSTDPFFTNQGDCVSYFASGGRSKP